MANWYGVQDTKTGKIISFTSDDAEGFGSLPAGLQYVGPYPTQQAALAALASQQR